MSTAIVGAGAAGLSLALMLEDQDVTIFETTGQPGGLCRSHQVEGFTFDTGPHILGGIPGAVDWIIQSTGLAFVVGETNNIGWHGGRWIAHPFDDPHLGKMYMAKMWKTDPAALSLPALGAQAGRRPGGVTRFRYPVTGGYQAITDRWAEQLHGRICYCEPFDDPDAFDRIVWTAPVTGEPYNTLTTVTAGFEGPAPDWTAIYLPGAWTPFHRLSFPAAFAPSNAPVGCHSIQAEMTTPHDETPVATLTALAATLERLDLGGDMLFGHIKITPHAYPVPTAPKIDLNRAVPEGPTGYPHGRTGARRYLNVDGVVDASMRLVETLGA